MRQVKQQSGFLMIALAFMIVIFALLSASLVHMFVTSTVTTTGQLASEQALYLAEAGLEQGKYHLLTNSPANFSTRLSCAAINGNVNTTNVNLGAGQFTVTTARFNPTPTALSAGINAAVTTIPVASTVGYAPQGRIRIDSETISYQGVTANSFTNATRGADSTTAASHSNGSQVTQNQCSLTSVGGVSSLATSLGRRQISEGDVSFNSVWSVGNSGNFRVWNSPTINTWTTVGGSTNARMNAVSMFNAAIGWSVGNDAAGVITVRGWNPSTNAWNTTTVLPIASNSYRRDLYGVDTVSASEAWAVGQRSNHGGSARQYTIMRFRAGAWCLLGPGGNPPGPVGQCSSITIPAGSSSNQNLNAVSMIDTNGNGFANFGVAVGNSGRILLYNSAAGGSWTLMASPTTSRLNGVHIVSTQQAWAVGNNGRILRWQAGNWINFPSPTGTRLNSVDMLDVTGNGFADFGLAVGNSGRGLVYNGTSWSINNIPGGGTYFSVTILSPTDAWAVGAGARRAHWDGTSWTLIASGGGTLRGVSAFRPAMSGLSGTGWQENIF